MFSRQMHTEPLVAVRMVLAVVLSFGFLFSQVSAADTRTTFAYTTGSFVHVAAGSWDEKRDDGTVSKFSEVARSDDYVELYDKARDMKVRLYATDGKWYSEKAKEWVQWPGSEGSWK